MAQVRFGCPNKVYWTQNSFLVIKIVVQELLQVPNTIGQVLQLIFFRKKGLLFCLNFNAWCLVLSEKHWNECIRMGLVKYFRDQETMSGFMKPGSRKLFLGPENFFMPDLADSGTSKLFQETGNYFGVQYTIRSSGNFYRTRKGNYFGSSNLCWDIQNWPEPNVLKYMTSSSELCGVDCPSRVVDRSWATK